MTPLVKIILVIIGLAYLISPLDLIPDLYLPWVGWIDDSLVIICLYHLIRYGKLPDFLFKKNGRSQSGNKKAGSSKTFTRPSPGRASGRSKMSQQSDTSQQSQTSQQSKSNNSFGQTSTIRSPYDILGVEENASWSQIQTAYKNKAKQYHPDKLSHLGEEFSTLANEKFLEIQEAFITLKKIYDR